MKVRTLAITIAGTAVLVAGIIIAIALALPSGSGAGSSPSPSPVTSSTATTGPPVIYKNTPAWDQFQACVFRAGYDNTTTRGRHLIFTGPGLPNVALTVTSSTGQVQLSPATGRDTVILNGAGCLA